MLMLRENGHVEETLVKSEGGPLSRPLRDAVCHNPLLLAARSVRVDN
jgi:hypothetical protein